MYAYRCMASPDDLKNGEPCTCTCKVLYLMLSSQHMYLLAPGSTWYMQSLASLTTEPCRLQQHMLWH